MPKITKLRAFTCVVVVVLFLGVVFWESLTAQMLENYLRSYCRKCWNADLQIEKIHRVDGKWILEKPVMISSSSLSDGGKNFHAERIIINSHLHPLFRQLDLKIQLVAPYIEISTSSTTNLKSDSTSAYLDFSLPNFPLLNVRGEITASDGILTVIENPSGGSSKLLPFELAGEWGAGMKGKFILWLEEQKGEHNQLILTMSEEDKIRAIEFDCMQVSCKDLANSVGKLWPVMENWKILQGNIHGRLRVLFTGNVLPYIIGDAILKEVAVENSQLHLRGDLPEIRFSIRENQSDNGKTRIGACELTKQATIMLQREEGRSWEIQDITGGVFFLPDNQMNIAFDGVCGQGDKKFPMHVSSKNSPNENFDIQLQLSGRGYDIAQIAPAAFKEGLEEKFYQDQLFLTASVKKISSGIHLDGEVGVLDDLYKEKDSIKFRCDLTQDFNAHEWAKAPHWQDGDLDALALALPAIMLWKHSDAASVEIENGWFEAQDLSLEKYIGAVVFTDKKLKLDGTVDLQGSFDQSKLTLKYDVHDFLLEHSEFILSIDQLSDAQTPQSAFHIMDLQTGEYKGFIPLQTGSYTDKNSGLTFSGIKAQITLEPHKLHAADVETFCHGLYLAGIMDIDYGKILEGVADISIHAHTMEGKLSNLKELASHLDTAFFLQECPFEGNIAFRKNGGHLRFNIKPEGVDVESHIQGSLSDGIVICKNKNLALRDLSSNFEYNHNSKFLEFSDIQGTFLVGSAENSEEYVFAGDHIRLNNLTNGESEFDVWIGDKSRDVIRIAGKTQKYGRSELPSGNFEVVLDRSLTHFGDVHPEAFQLVLRDWSHVENFNFSLSFQLNTLLQDMQRLSRTGLLTLSHGLLKGLNDLKAANGLFTVGVQYEDKTAQFSFKAKGTDVAVGDHHFKNCLLSATKKDNAWSIEQLLLDDLSVAADFSENESDWRVDFLGVHYGESILAGLQGHYFPEDKLFDAKINLLDINLEELDKLPALKLIVEKYGLKGSLHATGSAQLEFVKERPKWRLKADTLLSFNDCQMQGVGLKDAQKISCSYDSRKGISIGDFRTAIYDPETGQMQACININNADYDFANHEIIIDGLRFKIPSNNLPWIAAKFENASNDKAFGSKLGNVLKKIKSAGLIEGSINVSRSEGHRTIKLTLADGKYAFDNAMYELSKFIVEYDPLELRLSTIYNFQGNPLPISLRSRSLAMESGELVLGGSDGKSLLQVNWQTDPKLGLVLQRVDGFLNGMSVKLVRSPHMTNEDIRLNGEVSLDVWETVKYFPQDIKDLLGEWQIGGRYAVKGEWSIARQDLFAWEDKLHFEGILEGRQCQIKGFLLDSLSARLEATPKRAFIQQLDVNDSAGSAEAGHIEIVRNQWNQWSLKSPLITLKQFQPSLLRSSDGFKSPSDSTFVIRQLELKDFSGMLLDPKSFVAQGRAYVANPPKRETPNQFMKFPVETVQKYGLELSALCPIVGAIDYEVKDGRIYLKKLKEMYSAGKVSRFYLPKHSAEPSYVDFDGNLYLQIRMKQYNLLYKLAELFTVTIEGTIQQPRFSLFKNSSKEKEDIAEE